MGHSKEKMGKVTFEEALDQTGFGRCNLVIMILTCLIILAMGCETLSVAYLVPASACELETTSAHQGLMAAVPLFGILVASNIWGYLADTRGRRKIIIISLILGFITGTLATFSVNWIMFCLLKFLSSSSMAGTFGLAITYLSECTPAARRFSLIVLITSVFLSTAGCMAALTIPILPLEFSYDVPFLEIQFNSWRLLNIIYSIPCALAALGSFFAFESPKYLLSIGKEEEALKVLKRIFVINSGRSRNEYQVYSVTLDEDSVPKANGFWSSVISQTIPLLKPPLVKKTLLLSVLFICVYFSLHPFSVWLPYMVDGFMKSLEKGDIGLNFCDMLRSSQNITVDTDNLQACTLNETAMTMVFIMDMTLAAFNVIVSLILPCFGRKTLLIGIQLLAGTAAICINFSTVWIATAFLMIVFISGVLNFGLLSTFSVDVFPTYVKAMGVCLTLMVGRGSAVLGVNILKSLLDNHCEISFFMFGSITLFGGLVGFLLPSDKPKAVQRKGTET